MLNSHVWLVVTIYNNTDMDISIIAKSSISSAGLENRNQMDRMNILYLCHLGPAVDQQGSSFVQDRDYYHQLVYPVLLSTHTHLPSFLFVSKYNSLELPDTNKVQPRMI